MQTIQRIFRFRVVAITFVAFAFASMISAQVQTAAPVAAQNSGFCGGRPLCFEANDFAATLLEFRTSESGGIKVLDAALRFQNKTNQPLGLGYTDGSAFALDDRGNRFALNPWGGNGIRGMGIVNGNSIDPKFMLQPGGAADAHFELVWREGQIQGVSYELGLSIREIVPVEGNQFSLGMETPLDFQGLTNGVGAAPPSGVAQAYNGSQNPCGTMAGATNAVNTANSVAGTATSVAGQASSITGQTATGATSGATNQISSASSTISQLGSLFGKKSAAAPSTGTPATGTNVASAAPCPTSSTGGMTMPAYNGVGIPAMGGATQSGSTYGTPVNNTGVYQNPGTYQNTGTGTYQNPVQYQAPVSGNAATGARVMTQTPTTGRAVQAVPVNGNARIMAQPVGQPVRVVTPAVPARTVQAVPAQPVRSVVAQPVRSAVQTAPVAAAKPSPAQPVKAVAKTPVVVIPPKK